MATIHGFANRSGEYQRKPITMVATAAPSTAHKLTHMSSIVPLQPVAGIQAKTAKGRMHYRPRVYQILPGDS